MIMEELMLDLMYYLPSYQQVKEFVITERMVDAQDLNLTLLDKAG
jgi:ATP-dependent Clp protease ATP-binding subunit ClpX